VIKEVVASELGVDVTLLESPIRKKSVAFARQVAMYLAKRVGKYPYTQIASAFNRDDHTTVIHAVRKIEELQREDEKIKALLDKLEVKVRESVERSAQVIHTDVDNYVEKYVDN